MGLWQDVQFAFRLLIKDKWFTLVAVLALALGIGVNTTVFTFVNAILIRSLPFEDADRVMALNTHEPLRNRNMPVSYLDFKDWRDNSRTFSGLGAVRGGTVNISDEGRAPDRFSGAFMTANTFKIIGQSPALGRDFLPEDDRPGAPAVAIIGSSVWKNRYGSDPAIVGRTIRVNEIPSVVIGVMPEGFRFPFNTDVWQPLSAIPNLELQKRNARSFEVIGRLAPGVSQKTAEDDMVSIGRTLAQSYPDTNKDLQPRIQPYRNRVAGGPIKAVFLSLMGAVAFVLLIACANVANLLLARSAYRAREIAVRVSIGATRKRIVRQLLVEAVLLAIMSAILGLALSVVGIRLFDAATGTQELGRPYWIKFTMDTSVFGYLAAICIATAVLFGLAPALHASKTDVNEILKEGGRSGSAGVRVRRWTGALMVGQLALTLALLAGAGFMMRNFLTLYRMDVGFDTANLLTMALALPEAKYQSLEQRLDFYQRLQDRLGSNPSFRNVTVTSHMPLQGGFGRRLEIEGRPTPAGQQPPNVTMAAIDPRYFDALGMRLLKGRTFTNSDGTPGQDAVIINAKFAQQHFPNEEALGRRVTLSIDLSGGDPPPGVPIAQTVTIIGIAPNTGTLDFSRTEPDAIAYIPFRTQARGFMNLLARSSGDPNALIPVLREEVRALDADLPLFNIRTMDANLAVQRWPFRIFGSMFAIFAGIALMLSAVGLYAVTAYSVTQRTQEIGVRAALGAESRQVMWLFLRRALIQVGIGLTLGIGAALGVGKIFESAQLLVRTNGRDPVTITSIALLLAVVSIGACMWPARRATLLDPIVALRRD